MKESTLSIRLLWPFLRLGRLRPEGLSAFARERLEVRRLADPDARISHALVMELLDHAVAEAADPTLGLRAGEGLELGDLGAFEYAARSSVTLRAALECAVRYFALINDSVVVSLSESGSQATWRSVVVDGITQHPAANDFQLAAGVTLSRRLTGTDPALLEVHVAHPEPPYVREYERYFPEARLKFRAPENAIVFRRAHLETPLTSANPALQAAYVQYAEEELRRVEHAKSIAARVREALLARLRTGDVGMGAIARAFGMSPSTLRRRLDAEGTTLSQTLDDVRRDLALKYLRDPALSIGEVAFLLGFSHVPAFYKAFHRWHPDGTPADYRTS